LEKDVNGNSVKGEKTSVIHSSNCLVNLPDDKTAIIQGLENYIVVESDNRLLILNQKDEHNFKKYLKAIQ